MPKFHSASYVNCNTRRKHRARLTAEPFDPTKVSRTLSPKFA